MEKYNLNNRISELISREMLGTISEEDRDSLMDWVNYSDENKGIYEEVVKAGNWTQFLNDYNKVDTGAAWVAVNSKTFGKKRFIYSFLKYASIFIIPIFVAVFIYYGETPKEDRVSAVDIVRPGRSSAKLILAGGKQIALGEKLHSNIKEVDGTLINSIDKELKYINPDTVRHNENVINRIVTPKGGEFIVTLSDGTIVHLNNLSHLKFPVQFASNERVVVLTGEAFFNVAKDKSRPFIVKTKGIDVRVTGTKFNVKSYEDENNIETVLVEGGVNIGTKGKNRKVLKLKPSQKATYSKSEDKIDIKEVNVLLATNWINGKFSFQDERLEDIMTVLSRWYDISVFYQNSEIREARFTGSLNKYESIDPILDIIKITKKVDVNIKGNNIVFRAK